MTENVPSARVLRSNHTPGERARLADYLDGSDLAAALDAQTVTLVIDDPGPFGDERARAFVDAGAVVTRTSARLVVVVTANALARLRASLGPADDPLVREIARAIAADARALGRLRARTRTLDLAERARVMAILNVTPDSFHDGGKYRGVDGARARAAELVAAGADVIDIGGQSYAHWNPRIAAAEECERVVPVVEALVRDGIDAALSIDTFKNDVAVAALAAGAHLINDCSGLSDPDLAATVARYDAGLVVMHLKGELNVRAPEYRYADALGEITQFLHARVDAARDAGVADDAIIVDPGLEFGKEPATDLEILANFGEVRSVGYPLLVAASRKSFIGRILDRPARDLLAPSLATATLGILAGASMIRVHDVAETAQIATFLGAMRRARAVVASPAMPLTPAAGG